MTLKENIIQLEERLFQPHIRSSRERLLELLSPKFQEIGASGNCFGLAEVLVDLPTEQDWSIVTKDYEFHSLSDGLVRLTYRAFIRHSMTDPGVYSIRTSLWKNFDGQWKMEFHQSTKAPPFAFADMGRI